MPDHTGINLDITIEWGDGSKEKITTAYPIHVYEKAGEYDIKISGIMKDYNLYARGNYRDYIIKIKQWGDTEISNINFYNCINLSGQIPAQKIEGAWDDIKSMQFMFYGCKNIQSIEEGFTVPEGVTNLNFMFVNCNNLKILPENFTLPSTIKDMYQTFKGCSIIEFPESFTIPQSVTDMGGTFNGCKQLEELPENFKLPDNVKNINALFGGCMSLGELPETFLIPEGVTNMGGTFYNCTSLKKLPEKFTIPDSVTDISSSFYGCASLEKLPDNFEIPESVTTATSKWYGTFGNCFKLTGTITIKADLQEYNVFFAGTSANAPGTLTVNCTSNCTKILEILATKTSNNVVAGINVDTGENIE